MLNAISPIDGRYATKTLVLRDYFSEFALIKYRIDVEIRYLMALKQLDLPQLAKFSEEDARKMHDIIDSLSQKDVKRVKEIEATTNHDVKAVEYFIKEQMDKKAVTDVKEFIHFGLTSQDINNTAFPMMIKDALKHVIFPALDDVVKVLKDKASAYHGIPMLAKTHGQPASPTTMGKEFEVFIERLEYQMTPLKMMPINGKFGGATGNLNAHKVAFPDINWINFANVFLSEHLGLMRQQKTTQIEHYDGLAAIFDNFTRISTIMIDLCRDMWTYISMEYFGQKVVAGEIGSSAMPHKVNPIDFENAEGNLGIAIAVFQFLSTKLPISRLQRDLTDSTVLRNIGVPFSHLLIACKSIVKGLDKILLNENSLQEDLNNNWIVLAEPIQNILRREGYPKPYETLKALTRGKSKITREDLFSFVDNLPVDDKIKEEMRVLSPSNYVGYF